jgi:aminoglycoside/choline kinase family phosphotransferase
VIRAETIAAFLSAAGWAGAARAPLAGDASARRYERLDRAGRPAILMDVPPESGLRIEPFLAVDAWLRDGGFSAPEVYAADPETGLALLEDLGDGLYAHLLAGGGACEADLYAAAVDVLVEIQRRPPPSGAWTPAPYDRAFLMREVGLVPEWYLPAATGAPPSPGLVAEYDALCEAALAPVADVRAAPVLRDYHAENLLWLPDRAGRARVGILDFQDMLHGHPAYDLVSLLADARRDVPEALLSAMTDRYLAATGAEPAPFLRAAATLSVQRNLKILGLFTRLCRRDGKPRYLACLTRVWSYLVRDLAHPDLAPLAAFVRRHVPAPEPAILARIGGA